MRYKDTIISLDEIIKRYTNIVKEYMPNIITAIILLAICYILNKILKKIYCKIINKLFVNLAEVAKILQITVDVIYWIIVFVLILDVLNLSSFVTHLLAGAGIISIIVGLALKDLVSNSFSSLIIRIRHPFKTNDWITINDITGQVKTVSFLGTLLKTYEGQMAYIPNQLVLNSTFLNHSRYEEVKVIIDVGISYGDDLDHVEKVALDAIKTLPMIKKDKMVDFYYTNIGSSTYNFEVRYWVVFKDRIDFLYARSEGIKVLKKAFEKENIDVAYNVTTLDFGVKGGVNLYDNPIPFIPGNTNKIHIVPDDDNDSQDKKVN